MRAANEVEFISIQKEVYDVASIVVTNAPLYVITPALRIRFWIWPKHVR